MPPSPAPRRLAPSFPTRAHACAGAALVLLAALAAPAAAQTFRDADPARTPGWVFTPTFVASGAYDDNVTLAGQRAPTSSDTVGVLAPSGDVQWRGRHSDVNFGYNGSWSLYRQLNGLDKYDQTAYLDGHHELSQRVALLFHDSFAVHPTTDFIGLAGVPFIRAGSRLNEARGELKLVLGRHTDASASYSHEYVSFDKNVTFAQFLHGGTAHSVSGSVNHHVAPRLTIGATYTFRRATISGSNAQFDMQDAAGTVSYQPLPTVWLSGSLGYARLADLDKGTSQNGPSWHVTAAKQFQRLSVDAAYLRSYVPSFGLGGTQQNEEFDASLHMPLARNRLYWQSTFAWRRNEPLTLIRQRLTSLWFQNWVGYSLQRRLRLEAYYWRSQQDSQFAGGRVDRNRFGVQLVTSWPMRIQ